MPKVVDKEEMRNAILDAAMGVFADKGYHATSVSDVAEAAGLGKGTIYIYFKSKDMLTTAIVDRHFTNISKQIMDKKPCETLDAFLDGLKQAIDIPAEQVGFYRVFFEIFGPSFGSDAFTENVARFFNKLGSHYAKQITYLQTAGEIAEDHDAASLGRVFASMLDGMVLHQGLFSIPARRHRRMIKEAVAVLGIGLQSGPRKTHPS
ncbi:MAG: TetR/AcrR family transcriptional regulator [Parasphingorhabdus sp.]|uniref:TetR/AcrR family transcriptional regulator n=1 Tax=Parasphingorhabdus sp. TaxID=2709688 RepID=UPI00329686BE